MLAKMFLFKSQNILSCTISHRKIHIFKCLSQCENILEDVNKSAETEKEYNKLADSYFHLKEAHRCLIIQPYVKWGPKKLQITPEEQLAEAVALVNTLPSWKVIEKICIPLDHLERKALFKSGSMERLKNISNSNEISAVFVNSGLLKKATVAILQEAFGKPILDRYKMVMQILKTHATSKHAKLQVALAELYYLKRKSEQDLIFKTYSNETLKLMFQEREQKLKAEILKLRNQRSLLRNKRQKLNYPIVAVVGYTNAGKTSLIKALTGEESLQPKNQLFATLDVTVHSGLLPSGLEILYVDTVGFISDIPTDLIECFVATLEDALLADVILHVTDLSSSSYEYKNKHVIKTLMKLQSKTIGNVMDKIITIGNKCDLMKNNENTNILAVSAEKNIGLDKLKQKLESIILTVTSRQRVILRVPNGGDEIRWLHKNSVVLKEMADNKNNQFLIATVIITQAALQKFKHHMGIST